MARLVAATVRGAGRVPVTVKVRKGIDDRLLTFLDSGRVAEAEGAAPSGCTPAPRPSSTPARPTGTPSARSRPRCRSRCSATATCGSAGTRCACCARPAATASSSAAAASGGRGCSPSWPRCSTGASPAPQPRFGEIAALMRRHAELLVDFFGPLNGMRQMRKWCAWYTAGFQNSAAVRARTGRHRERRGDARHRRRASIPRSRFRRPPCARIA